jgi:hypothetical protein
MGYQTCSCGIDQESSLIVGQGLVHADAASNGDGGDEGKGKSGSDDALQDDQAKMELENAYIKEEWDEIENEIENAKEDAMAALEEGRQEAGEEGGIDSVVSNLDITKAKETVVE